MKQTLSRIFSLLLSLPACLALLTLAPGCSTTAPNLPSGQETVAGSSRPLRESLVELHTTCVFGDAFMPWRLQRPSNNVGYAVAIEPHLLLAPEQLIRNAAVTKIRRAGQGRFETVEVKLLDARAGLALLTLPESAVPLHPLPVAERIARHKNLMLAHFGSGDQVLQAPGTITSIEMEYVNQASDMLLTFDIVSDLRSDTPGTPVLADGCLAGMVMRLKRNSDASLALAPDVIQGFLQAAAGDSYQSLPAAGFHFASLADPVRRRYLGVPDDEIGIQVINVIAGSAVDGLLQADDVLRAWNDYDIDSEGYINHGLYGRMPLKCAIAESWGMLDRTTVTFLREGEEKTIEVSLRPPDEAAMRVPENAVEAPNDYLVEGGLIFRELTQDYLRARGDRWEFKVATRLAWEALNQADSKGIPGERVVILSRVLPHPVNVGYEYLNDEIVTSVNGQPVRNLRHLAAIIDRDGGLETIELVGWQDVPLSFDKASLRQANLVIQMTYRIPALRRIELSPTCAIEDTRP